MAIVASTVLYSMSSMLCKVIFEGEVWLPQQSDPSTTNPRADGKTVSSERGGVDLILVLGPASFSAFSSSEEIHVVSLLLSFNCTSTCFRALPASCCGSGSSPCTNPSAASCSKEEEEKEEDDDEEEASIFSSFRVESRFSEVVGVGSGEGGSCSVPGSIREESLVSVSEVLVGVNASWSDFSSLQLGRAKEEAATMQMEGSLTPSSSLHTLRRFTGVTPSSLAATERQKNKYFKNQCLSLFGVLSDFKKDRGTKKQHSGFK